MDAALFRSYRDRIINNVGKMILGKDEMILRVIVTYLCSGHVLLEDVPGTGKTMLLRAFARSVGGDTTTTETTAKFWSLTDTPPLWAESICRTVTSTAKRYAVTGKTPP